MLTLLGGKTKVPKPGRPKVLFLKGGGGGFEGFGDLASFGSFFFARLRRAFALCIPIFARRRREKSHFQDIPPLKTAFSRIFFGRAFGAVCVLNALDKSNFSPPQARKNRMYRDFPLENSVFLPRSRFVFDVFLKEIALLQRRMIKNAPKARRKFWGLES